MKILHRVRGLVERGERLEPDDCRALLEVHDLNRIARLANIARERRHGHKGGFRVVQLMRYHGEMDDLFISELETRYAEEQIGFLIWPDPAVADQGEELIEKLRSLVTGTLPTTLYLSPSFLSKLEESGSNVEQFLASLPEGKGIVSSEGAGLFQSDWRDTHATDDQISAETWLAMHQKGHRAGLRGEASMVYGGNSSVDAMVEHLTMLREVQDATGQFVSFRPVPLLDRSISEKYRAWPTAVETLRLIAVARLYLDNIDHIVVSGAEGDPEIAFAALNFGADVVDPVPQHWTSGRDRLAVRPEGSHNPFDVTLPVIEPVTADVEGTEIGFIESRIVEARFQPVPLDSLFRGLEYQTT